MAETGSDGFREPGARVVGLALRRARQTPAGISSMPWREVIGVIEDVHENGVEKKPPETVYWPTMMRPFTGPTGWTRFAP